MSADSVYLTVTSIVDGEPVTNASTGDRFTVKLSPPWVFDDSENYEILPVSCNAWFSAPNVDGSDNIFRYTVNTTGASGAAAEVFTITIPTGLYSYQDLEGYIATQTADEAHGSYDHPLFSFIGSAATQTISIIVDASGTYIGSVYNNGTEDRTVVSVVMDGTVAESVLTGLLGFDSLTYTADSSGDIFNAQNLADMDRGVTSYLVHCDLVAGSVGPDGVQSSIAVNLPLEVAPNTQVNWENKLSNYTLSLSRRRTDSVSVWLTSNTGVPISLNNNPYTLTLLIRRKESQKAAERLHKMLSPDAKPHDTIRSARNLAAPSV